MKTWPCIARWRAGPEVLGRSKSSSSTGADRVVSNANQPRRLSAQLEVLLKAKAGDRQGKYSAEIAERLWEVATGAASYVEWETADKCGRIAFELAGLPRSQSPIFRTLCRLGPPLALRLREGLIRLIKPRYRVDYPAWHLARTSR